MSVQFHHGDMIIISVNRTGKLPEQCQGSEILLKRVQSLYVTVVYPSSVSTLRKFDLVTECTNLGDDNVHLCAWLKKSLWVHSKAHACQQPSVKRSVWLMILKTYRQEFQSLSHYPSVT